MTSELEAFNETVNFKCLELINSSYLAAGTHNGRIYILNYINMSLFTILKHNNSSINDLLLINRTILVSASEDGSLKFLNIETLSELKYINKAHNQSIKTLRLFRDSSFISMSSNLLLKEWRLFDFQQISIITTFCASIIRSVDVFYNVNLVIGCDISTRVFNSPRSFLYLVTPEKPTIVLKILKYPFVACGLQNGKIFILDINTQIFNHAFDAHNTTITAIEYLQNNILITSCLGNFLKIWNLTSKKIINEYKLSGPINDITSVGNFTLNNEIQLTNDEVFATKFETIEDDFIVESERKFLETTESTEAQILISEKPISNSSNRTNLDEVKYETIKFEMSDLNKVIKILEMNFDLNDCLKNCSNQGRCKFIEKKKNFLCECDVGFYGESCQKDSNPCSSNPCLNKGLCVTLEKSSFKCECLSDYYGGEFCEQELDLCQNVTCSSQGRCLVQNHKPRCICYSSYHGEKCQFESNEELFIFGMSNLLDGSSTLETPSAVPDEASIDSTTSIQTNQTITPPSPPPPPLAASTQNLGFCYSCNRRSLIDTSNFSCSNCSSGFVELISDSNTTTRTRPLHDLDSILHNPLFRYINDINSHELNETSTISSSSSSDNLNNNSSNDRESESFFSRFRVGLRRHEMSSRNRFRNYTGDTSEDSLTSSSSRRRSRSPPILGRANLRSYSRTRFLDNIEDESNMFIDHGAIIITTLINQLRNRGAAPASDTQIQNIPLISIDQKLVDDSSQCAVCMDDFALNEQAKKLPCKHLFHDSCIAQWLKLHATCPVCRNNINGEESNNSNGSTSNLLNDNGPTFFNFIPFTDEPTSPNTTNNTTTTPPTQSITTRSNPIQRRNHNIMSYLRNPSYYRVHIRPNLNSSDTQRSDSNNTEPIVSRLRSGIRVTTRLNNDREPIETTNSDVDTRLGHRLNLNQMMQQFISRHRADELNTPRDREQTLRSSIRVSTRLTNSEPTNTDNNSNTRYNNMMQHLMHQYRQGERTLNVNREMGTNTDDDVIEIEPERSNQEESNSRQNDDIPNAKRRRV
ncbi:unnamed protein product [Brachionus calyciflorus]|uniref:RING-type E3 ubiquitin transferase n=1 Tax=Brachionus calyciflorus TaxID=104777 RepID=A0A813TN64_9BILA|nr:unnamed protein product [Brachionus calyciflorus]